MFTRQQSDGQQRQQLIYYVIRTSSLTSHASVVLLNRPFFSRLSLIPKAFSQALWEDSRSRIQHISYACRHNDWIKISFFLDSWYKLKTKSPDISCTVSKWKPVTCFTVVADQGVWVEYNYRTEDKVVQWQATQCLRQRGREGGRSDRGSDYTVMTVGTGADWTTDLLAWQLVNTMYEVTVSSVDAVGPLRVVTASRVTHTWRRGCGRH